MFVKFVIFFLAFVCFKLYVIFLFNYENFFDGKLPKHDSYDFIIGELK